MPSHLVAKFPIATEGDPEPFLVRFKVSPLVLLDLDRSPPMLDATVWDNLEETKGITKGSRGWGISFRGSLRGISSADGAFLMQLLQKQLLTQTEYPLTERDQHHLTTKRKVQTLTGQVEVEVPEKGDDQDELVEHESDEAATHIAAAAPKPDDSDVRQSIQIQAQIAENGASFKAGQVSDDLAHKPVRARWVTLYEQKWVRSHER